MIEVLYTNGDKKGTCNTISLIFTYILKNLLNTESFIFFHILPHKYVLCRYIDKNNIKVHFEVFSLNLSFNLQNTQHDENIALFNVLNRLFSCSKDK